jgi:hypothetical protein
MSTFVPPVNIVAAAGTVEADADKDFISFKKFASL